MSSEEKEPRRRPSEEGSPSEARQSELSGGAASAEATGTMPEKNVAGLKGNFEQQQAMIGQLRDMLKNKEASKRQEKDFEDYATRLAKMKPRLIRGRGRGRSKDRDDSAVRKGAQAKLKSESFPEEEIKVVSIDPVQLSSVASEKVEESSDDSPSKVTPPDKASNMQSTPKNPPPPEPSQAVSSQHETGSRAKILLLRKQLEENRLKFERQQRENADKRATMEDMKERIDKLRTEVEKRDSLIQSLQEVDSSQQADHNVQHLFQQILHKDNTVLELSDKVNHLENVIKDQEEQLNEKDQIISARTEAVSLISKDRDEKMMKTIQELDEMRIAMKQMQEDFTLKEEQWKDKEINFENIIAGKNKKITVLEENSHRVENIRFELSTRNAELQEKIISLQCDSKQLKKEFEEAKSVMDERSNEFDEVKKKLIRAEAFGQKKLKALEKQIKSISEDGNLGNQIVELQNQIAELEEEKGNLQLKLVDFDEIKSKCDKLTDKVSESGTKIEQLDSEILTQIAAVGQLENEKIKLVEELNSKDLKINILEEDCSKFKAQYENVKQSQVTLELRLCEVEEERDLALKTKKDLENEQRNVDTIDEPSVDFETKRYEHEQEVNILQSQIEERNSRIANFEKSISEKEELIKKMEEEKEEKEYKNQCLISFLAEKESLISSQSIKLEKHDSVVESLQAHLSSKANDIQNLVEQSNFLKIQIDSLNEKLNESETSVLELTSNLSELQNVINFNEKTITELKDANELVQSVLKEKENMLLIFEGEINSMKEEINKRDAKLSDQICKIESLDSMLQSREKQILNLESEIADKLRENSQQEEKCTKYENEIKNLQTKFEQEKSKFTAECDAIACLLSDKENQIEVLVERVNVKEAELKNSEKLASSFEQEACEKNLLYDNLLEEKNRLADTISKLETKLAEVESNSKLSNDDITNLQQIIQENESSTEQLKIELINNSEKLREMEDASSTLEQQKQKLEEDMSEMREQLEAKDNYSQQLYNEFQTYAAGKEDECSQLLYKINEKDLELNSLKESLTSEKGEIEQNYIHNVQRVESLERELAAKEAEKLKLQEEITTKNYSLSELNSELEISKNNVLNLNNQIGELTDKLQLLTEKQGEAESELESLKALQMQNENEIYTLKSEIESKNAFIIHLENEGSFPTDRVQAIDSLEALNKQLQEKLDEKTAQLDQCNKFYEVAIEEETLKSNQLSEEISAYKTQVDEKTNEIMFLQVTCQDLSSKVNYYEKELKSQNVFAQENENFIEKLRKVEEDCVNYQQELIALKQQLQEERTSYANLISLYEVASQKVLQMEEESKKLHLTTTSQAVVSHGPKMSEDDDTLSENIASTNALKENINLKKQLEEAQQAIVRLETSLATQTLGQDTSQEGSDGWGVVDLGEPSVAEPTPFMQTSLLEKDKALTVTQEQLKNALEEVNTANDEKKIIQHQMKTLEAELSHKDQKIVNLEARISGMNNTITELNQKLMEFSSTYSPNLEPTVQTEAAQLTMADAPPPSDCGPETLISSQSAVSNEQGLPIANSATWFKADTSTADNSSNFWDTIESVASVPQTQPESESHFASYAQNTEVQSEVPQAEKESESLPGQSVEELQYKLSWYEENWVPLTEHYSQLQERLQTAEQHNTFLSQELETLKQLREQQTQDATQGPKLDELEETIVNLKEEKSQLEEQFNKLRENESSVVSDLTSQHNAQLEKANQEISKLKGFETQVYELQGHLQTLQHQCSILESKVGDAELNSSKVREYEMLYGELQTCMQEAETKSEGSKSRVQELELMVQSAESEIARLRSDLQKLTSAGDALESERNLLQDELQNIKNEVRKTISEKERLEKENDILQKEVASLDSQLVESEEANQRSRGEIEQLKSELEVLEGDNDRSQSNYEVMESEVNRLRHEKEVLSQIHQITLAEKESLETEAQRLEGNTSTLASERDHIKREMQRMSEIATSAESEISRLQYEVQNMNALKESYCELERKNLELQDLLKESKTQDQDAQELQLEEVDWSSEAKIEDEHLQRSSSVERTLQDELAQLKEKIISLEKEKNEANDELQAAKLKNGKMIQKLKAANHKNENLQKEIKKLNKKAGGFSDLDLALEEEWKSQVVKAEGERDELKIRLDEIEKEKDHLKNSLDVLETAQDKYFEMKESQDVNIRQLSAKNKNLQSQIASLEWKISELEENSEQNQNLSFSGKEESTPVDNSLLDQLKSKISELESEIQQLKEENTELKSVNAELAPKLNDLANENESLTSLLEDMRDSKKKSDTDINTYKTSFLELHTEHENLLETHSKVNKNLESITYEQNTLKAAYDVLYDEYHQLQDNRDSVRLELGIVTGERDKLQEEVNSLNNQLQALQEEEEEEIIRALQDECSDLRDQNSGLKDEITRMNESLRQMEETVERTKTSLDQQVDIQDMLRHEVVNKSSENDDYMTTINRLEQQIKYMTAENASLKTKCSQQQQALERMDPELESLKGALVKAQEKNTQLIKQVELADDSLVKLATRQQANQESEERFSSLEASELEAALSSLHLRDLRCQQLSLEINKLLEERDGLQLKLSAALRQTQDLTRELSLSQQLPTPYSTPPSLSQKLAELRDLNSSLEQKALDNLRVGSLSTLPPSLPTFVSHTAPATPTATRHLDYTVTRENQGASSVIMNWFLGKSTPKEILHV